MPGMYMFIIQIMYSTWSKFRLIKKVPVNTDFRHAINSKNMNDANVAILTVLPTS